MGGWEQRPGNNQKEKMDSSIYTIESQKNINLLPSKRRSSMAKHVQSTVTLFPLRNGRRGEERIALFPISVLLLVTHSSRRPIDLNFTRSFLPALPQRHQPFIHNWRPAKWMLDNWYKPRSKQDSSTQCSPGAWIKVINLFVSAGGASGNKGGLTVWYHGPGPAEAKLL